MQSNRIAADAVRAEMARRRISQQRLATQLNLSQAAISRRLTGDVPFSVPELSATAELLGVSEQDLISGGVQALAGVAFTDGSAA